MALKQKQPCSRTADLKTICARIMFDGAKIGRIIETSK